MMMNQPTKALLRRTTARRLAKPTALLLGLVASLAGCSDPPVDTNTPTPTGVVRGTIQYIGRRVDCTYEGGVPVAVKGIVILTLIDNANPLPPEGTATLPVDIKAIGGEDVFTDLATDCLPEGMTGDEPNQVIIQRSYAFEWTKLPLGPAIDAAAGLPDDAYQVGYRVLATYDQEGDFNPLFNVTQAPSAGDVAGGAIENPLAPVPVFHVITFDSVSLAPLGQVREGINISMGAVVMTDSPLMRIVDGDLSAQQGWGGFETSTSSYPPFDLTLYGRTPGVGDRVELDSTLDALELENRFDMANPLKYAWYIEPLDVDRDGNTTCTALAGDPDCHPLMGVPSNSQWKSPVVFLQRIQSAIETAVGVPSVAFIPGAGFETMNRRAQYPDIRLRIAPLAALLTNPAVPECRMIYFADGSSSASLPLIRGGLPDGSSMECSELPTGYYGTNVLSGFAIQSAAQVGMTADTSVSNTGFTITGGQLASQLWTVPNVLGDWRQVGDTLAAGGTDLGSGTCLPPGSATQSDPRCLPEQSLQGAFVVHDPNPTGPIGRNDPAGAGASCSAYNLTNDAWTDDPARTNDYFDLCCGSIMHLCDVPLCPFVTNGVTQTWSDEAGEMNMNVRGQPTAITGQVTVTVGGQSVTRDVPDCISFPMPSQCCL